MTYSSHFQHADDIISHLRTSVIPHISSDPLLEFKYAGFVAIAGVTVYELAIKDIFQDFATSKHKILGNFTETYFKRINGRIKLKVIKDDYIKRFGQKYHKRFNRNLNKVQKDYLMLNRRDICNSYANLITWRHEFAHEGKIPNTATFLETVQAYEDGKEIIHCLNSTMYW